MKVKLLFILIFILLLTGCVKEREYKIYIVYEGSNEFWDVRFIYRANPEEIYDEKGTLHYKVNDKDELWIRYKGEEKEVNAEYWIFPVGGTNYFKRNEWTVIPEASHTHFSEYDKPVIKFEWDKRSCEIKLEAKEVKIKE